MSSLVMVYPDTKAKLKEQFTIFKRKKFGTIYNGNLTEIKKTIEDTNMVAMEIIPFVQVYGRDTTTSEIVANDDLEEYSAKIAKRYLCVEPYRRNTYILPGPISEVVVDDLNKAVLDLIKEDWR